MIGKLIKPYRHAIITNKLFSNNSDLNSYKQSNKSKMLWLQILSRWVFDYNLYAYPISTIRNYLTFVKCYSLV